MSILTWKTKKELNRDDFCRRKNMEIGGEKMRNASHQVLDSTYDITYKRCVTRKFYVVVVQDNVKEIY